MTHLRKVGVMVLVLASLLSPAMACTVADLPMTSEERACCQSMMSHCEQEQLPASHGCCHKIPGSIYENALRVKAAAFHSALGPVTWLPAQTLGIPTRSILGWVEHRDGSPPKPPPSTISILRI